MPAQAGTQVTSPHGYRRHEATSAPHNAHAFAARCLDSRLRGNDVDLRAEPRRSAAPTAGRPSTSLPAVMPSTQGEALASAWSRNRPPAQTGARLSRKVRTLTWRRGPRASRLAQSDAARLGAVDNAAAPLLGFDLRDGPGAVCLQAARVKRERGARSYGLYPAAAPATVSGERRSTSHCRQRREGRATRQSREPGDLPARVAHQLRGARG
jgi:hypothetical protein